MAMARHAPVGVPALASICDSGEIAHRILI
jgi:hypothetical protein